MAGYDTARIGDSSPLSQLSSNVSPYRVPEYNLGRIGAITQQLASPGVRQLRRRLQETMLGGEYNSPTERSIVARGALEGYGEGLEKVTQGARSAALAAYQPEYATAAEANRAAWMEQMLRERMAGQERSAIQSQSTQAQRIGDIRPTTYMRNVPWLWEQSQPSQPSPLSGQGASQYWWERPAGQPAEGDLANDITRVGSFI